MLNFKPTFSVSSFTFIKRLLSSSSLSTRRVVSSAYLRLLIFLLAILIPACASSSLAFYMMFSAYKLNKKGDNTQPWCTPFPIWNQFVILYPVLTVASWPADFSGGRSGGLVVPSLEECPTVCCDPDIQRLWRSHKAKEDVFLELSLFRWSNECWEFDLWFHFGYYTPTT